MAKPPASKPSSSASSSPRRRANPPTAQADWGQLQFELELAPSAPPSPAALSVRKPRRAKVPDNLAAQYGENATKRVVEVPPAGPPRKRRTAAEREQRKQLMAPDEGLLQRLARVNAVGARAPKRVSVPRGMWQFLCGRCGVRTNFEAAAGVCPGCGAIALKE